jgi:5-methylcytosine-specific restriction endonuclease McrA
MKRSSNKGWEALDWPSLVRAYAKYWRLPFVTAFGNIAVRADGRLPKEVLRRRDQQRRDALARLKAALKAFDRAELLPRRPRDLTQGEMKLILKAAGSKGFAGLGVGRREFQTFWEAVVLTKAGFRCEYCGRNAFEVFRERRGRSALRMVVDHCEPLRRSQDGYVFMNCVAACWSCNHLKGGMPRFLFEEELKSLGRAVTIKGGFLFQTTTGRPLQQSRGMGDSPRTPVE